MHLLVLLLQQLLGALLNKSQLQPEVVRRRPSQEAGGEERAECRGLSFAAIDWLTVLFEQARFLCAPVPLSPQFLARSRRTFPLSTRLRT